MAGFRSPLFILGLSAPAQQAGYFSVLPVPNLAGFGQVAPVRKGSGGSIGWGPRSYPTKKKIDVDDDQVMMAIIAEFIRLEAGD